MHFGRNNIKLVFKCLAVLLIATSCSCKPDKPAGGISFITPEIGSTLQAGQELELKLDFKQEKVDSVVYLLDSTVIGRRNDSSSVKLSTSKLRLGNRLITARVYKNGAAEEVTTNLILHSGIEPEKYTYQVIQTFPHDTSSYTQGLEFHDGILYESDGEYGQSSLRKVEIASGRVLQKTDIPANIFAEGITVVDNKIIQITYHENVFIVYDKNTLNKIGEFAYPPNREGWGLAFDGTFILNSDGTNVIHFLNKETFAEEKYLEVYDKNGPVTSLNELEYIEGQIYANVYSTDKIVIINPETGAVTGEINFTGIYPPDRFEQGEVLNGIAYDPGTRHLYVTGKKWNKLFQIRLAKKEKQLPAASN
jgi:glutaminyl-peptide cyclotransferase